MKSVTEWLVDMLVDRIVDPVVAQQAKDEELREIVEAVTAAAKKAKWAIEGKRVTLSQPVRARIADAIADGELPGDLAHKAYRAGWPTPVCSAVARYGRRVQKSVAAGNKVNQYWGDLATA